MIWLGYFLLECLVFLCIPFAASSNTQLMYIFITALAFFNLFWVLFLYCFCLLFPSSFLFFSFYFSFMICFGTSRTYKLIIFCQLTKPLEDRFAYFWCLKSYSICQNEVILAVWFILVCLFDLGNEFFFHLIESWILQIILYCIS